MKLSKKSIPYRAARNLGTIGLVFLFSSTSSLRNFNLLAAALLGTGVLIAYAVMLAWEYLVWKNYSYSIEEDKIKITKGVIRKNQREIPLKRIQNVDISRNIVHRVVGLSKVDLETAGGSDTEASLKYVTPDEGERIREQVKEGAKAQTDEEKDTEDQETFYEISDGKLVLLSAISLDRRTLFGFFTIFAFFSAGLGVAVENLGLPGTVILSVLLTGTAILIFLSNFVINFEKYYGFRLWRNRDSLRYERGLLNRKEGSIPLDKIQTMSVEENILKRLTGYATLKIETAGYSGEKAMKQGSEAAIPLDSREAVVRFAEKLQDIKTPETQEISRKARRRYFARYSLITLPLVILSVALNAPAVITTATVVLSVLTPLAAHLKWKNRGYGTGKEHFRTVNGFWNRKTMITPYYRIQNLIETRSIFQRRWNLSSLTMDVAGAGRITDNPVIHDLDREKSRKLKERIYASFQESLKNEFTRE